MARKNNDPGKASIYRWCEFTKALPWSYRDAGCSDQWKRTPPRFFARSPARKPKPRSSRQGLHTSLVWIYKSFTWKLQKCCQNQKNKKNHMNMCHLCLNTTYSYGFFGFFGFDKHGLHIFIWFFWFFWFWASTWQKQQNENNDHWVHPWNFVQGLAKPKKPKKPYEYV